MSASCPTHRRRMVLDHRYQDTELVGTGSYGMGERPVTVTVWACPEPDCMESDREVRR